MSSSSISTTSAYASIFSRASIISNAWLRNSAVTALRSSRDIDDDRSKFFLESYIADDGHLKRLTPLGITIEKPIVFDISPSGTKTLSLKHGKEEKPIVEVFDSNGDSVLLDASEIHGKFIGDSWFGGCSWSSDERFVAYVAQQKPQKSKSSFDKPASCQDLSDLTKYDYVEDWGEKYVGVQSLVIAVVDLSLRRIVLLPDVDDRYTLGQPMFHPDDSGRYRIAYTAWNNHPRRLGMIYCYQRPCSIFLVDVTEMLMQAPSFSDSESPASLPLLHVLLTPRIRLARSARFSPKGDTLIFMGSEKGFASHSGPSQLFQVRGTRSKECDAWSFSEECTKVVIDAIETPAAGMNANDSGWFPGLFGELPRQCFVDDDTLQINSAWGSRDSVVQVTLSSGSCQRLDVLNTILDDSHGDVPLSATSRASSKLWNNVCDASSSVLDISGQMVLFSSSSPTQPQRIGLYDSHLGKVVARLGDGSRHWLPPVYPITAKVASAGVAGTAPAASLALMRWRVIPFEAGGIPYEAILIMPPPSPTDVEDFPPLVVVPHGGPHSVMPTSFVASYAYLSLQLSAAVLHVNFRGSTGFGAASINSLLGNIGTNDVADVVAATLAVLAIREASPEAPDGEEVPIVDSNRVSVVGGSHGGFLAGHLIGQHPDIFKVAAMRNPVTNIPSMLGVSDIPDWCYVEALGASAYDFETFAPPTEAALSEMLRRSPIAHIEQVRAPTLICVGSKDRRVPSSQGIEYYHLLRARGVPCRMLVFPEDVHAIDRPASEADHWVAIADWLRAHMGRR